MSAMTWISHKFSIYLAPQHSPSRDQKSADGSLTRKYIRKAPIFRDRWYFDPSINKIDKLVFICYKNI